MRDFEPRNNSKKPDLSWIWKTLIILTTVFSIILIILVSVLIANLKSSGDAFQGIIGSIMSSDFPSQIQNGMMELGSFINLKTTYLELMLTNTPYCKGDRGGFEDEGGSDDWKYEGKDLYNNKKGRFKTSNLFKISQYCEISSGGRFWYNETSQEIETQYLGSSISSIKDGLIYFTNPNGNISCYHLYSCELIWDKSISSILGYSDDIIITSVTTPTIFKSVYSGIEGIIFGTPGNRKDILNKTTGKLELNYMLGITCQTIALNRFTGELLFKTLVGIGTNRDYFCEQKTSYSIYNDIAISGLDSSNDYFALGSNGYNFDVTFQGSINAINISTGLLLWKTYLLNGPLNGLRGGYSGGGVTGSNPPILADYSMVFFANKHLYNYTQEVNDCLTLNINSLGEYDINDIGIIESYHICLEEAIGRNELVLFDSVFAVNIYNGQILWTSQGIGLRNGFGIDARTQGCKNGTFYQGSKGIGEEFCILNYPGPGFGYTEQPILYQIYTEWRISALNLGGVLYSWNAIDGSARWGQNVSTGSTFGSFGLSFNSDLYKIFVTISGTSVLSPFYNENYQQPFTLLLSNSSILCNSGIIFGIDALSGDILWESVLPYNNIDTCSLSNSIEYFKKTLNFTSIDGKTSVPSFITTFSITNSPCSSSQPSTKQNYSLIYGNPITSTLFSNHLLFISTLLGDLYILNAENGQCLIDLSCNQGAIMKGPSFVDNYVLYPCGSNDNNYLLNGNTINVYK